MSTFRAGLVICVIFGSLIACPNVCNALSNDTEFWSELDVSQNPDSLLEEILSRKEFKEAIEPTLMDKAVEIAFEILRRALRWLTKHLPSSARIGNEVDFLQFVLNILILSLVVLLVLFIVMIVIRYVREKRPSRIVDSEMDVDPLHALPSTRKLWNESLKAAEQGNYREALVALFRAILVNMDQRGLLSYHSVKTNREILHSVASHTGLRQLLSEMIPMFNSVFYGEAVCDKPKYERFRALYEQAIERI